MAKQHVRNVINECQKKQNYGKYDTLFVSYIIAVKYNYYNYQFHRDKRLMFRSLAKVFPQYVAYVYDFVDQLHLNSWAITKTIKKFYNDHHNYQ